MPLLDGLEQLDLHRALKYGFKEGFAVPGSTIAPGQRWGGPGPFQHGTLAGKHPGIQCAALDAPARPALVEVADKAC